MRGYKNTKLFPVMKRFYLFLILGLCLNFSLEAQVKIGNNPQDIHPASVLELESSDKVLVITRVTTVQMNAITPLQGAMVYNTDLQSVHYYDGTQWINLQGSTTGGTTNITTDAIVNNGETIVLTPTANGDNLEVAAESIGSDQIKDGGITGNDIADGSIGPGKIVDNSVTQSKLSENSVGPTQLDNANIGLEDFSNAVTQFITTAELISDDPENVLEQRADGAFYNDDQLVLDIALNEQAIANHVNEDLDISPNNEIQNLTINGTILGLSGTAGTVNLDPLLNLGSTDNQNLSAATLDGSNLLTIDIEDGDPVSVDLSSLAGGSDNQNLSAATLDGSNQLTIAIEDGNPVTVDLSSLAGGSGGTDDQTLSLNGNIITIEDGNEIDLTPILVPAGSTDDQDLGAATLDAANLLTIEIEGGNSTSVDLSSLAGGAGGTQNLSEVLNQGNDASASGITNLTTDATDLTAAATVDYVNNAVTAGGTPLVFDGTVFDGDGTSTTPYTIQPGTNGQILSTDTNGDVIWTDVPSGGTVTSDGLTITGDGGATPLTITPATIDAVTPVAQILSTDISGAVIWTDVPASTGTTEIADQVTITGQGTAGDAFSVADAAITPIKIEPATIDAANPEAQILSTNIDGDVVWTDVPAGGTISADGTTITGDGGATPLSIAPATIDAANPEAQILSTNIDGDVVWTNVPSIESITFDNILVGNATNEATQVPIANIPLSNFATATDSISLGNFRIKDILDPIENQDAATKAYVDAIATVGDSITLNNILIGNADNEAIQVPIDSIPLSNFATATDSISLGNFRIKDILDPIENQDAATKAYVDANGNNLKFEVTTDSLVIEDKGGRLGIPRDSLVHRGASGNIFFAGNDGKPTDTEATLNTKDNGGFYWDENKRFQTGALYLGLKQNGNTDLGNVGAFSNFPGNGHSKLVVMERYDDTTPNGEFTLAFPIQVTNETTFDGAGTGILFANNITGNPGNAALVFQKGITEGDSDFHVMIRNDNDGARPNFTDDVKFTIEDDGDVKLTGNIIDKNGGTPSEGQVLTTNATGETVWADGSAHMGTVMNVFFAGTDGKPIDTEGNDDTTNSDSTKDNGGFFWDTSKRFNTGTLYLGLKGNGNIEGTSILESSTLGHSKLVVAEKYVQPTGEFSLSFPLQLRNESDTNGSGSGLLFSINSLGNPGKGAIAFRRGANESDGDFHFLVSKTGVGARPAWEESVLTIEDDGDIKLTGNIIDKNGGTPSEGQVLTTNATGETVWDNPNNIFSTDLKLVEDRLHNLDGNDFILGGSGTIGIGIFDDDPTNNIPALSSDKLHVAGQARIQRGIAANGGSANEPSYSFFTNNDSDTGMYRAGVNRLGFSTAGVDAMQIDASQNVGIGTTSPTRKLHVNGDLQVDTEIWIGTDQVIVPDYVFQKYFLGKSILNENYSFQTLEEIEAFIKTNHHLPGIKSAKEVKEDGSWNLSKSNLQNLEKIEELYLHTINQEKKIKKLEADKENVSKELDNLKKELEEIKKLLQNK